MTPEQRARQHIWLRDESLEDTARLPDPDILATEIVEDLEAALEQFREIAEELGEDELLEA
jgi:type I restriction enzyme M protein